MSFRIRHISKKEGKGALLAANKIRKNLPWQALLTVIIAFGKPMLELGIRLHEKQKRRQHMKSLFSVGISIVAAIAIALVVLTAIVKISGSSLQTLTKMSGTPVGHDDNGMTNILVLGQGDEKGIDLTDAVMVISIDPKHTNSIAILSLPRDLYFLHTDSMETDKGKLNLLWRDNRILLGKKGLGKKQASALSMRQLADEIGNALGIEIHHTVKVDFIAFSKLVDAMGGLDIDVPEEIYDEKFPDGNYGYETFHISRGKQHIDGNTALKYARSRSTTSDFDRSARQQLILHAAMKQAKETRMLKHPKKVLEIFSILSGHIETDLKTRQIVTLLGILRGIDRNNFSVLQLNDVNGLYGEPLHKGGLLYAPPRNLFDGEFVLLPVSIPEFPVTWKQIRLLSKLFFGKRTPYLDHQEFSVLNGGAPEKSASRVGRELTKFGFDVVSVTNTPNRKDVEQSFISKVTNDADNGVVEFFAKFLQIPAMPLPENIREKADGSIAIVLGRDFKFKYFQFLPLMQN